MVPGRGDLFPQWCSHWQVAYALGNNPTHAHIGYPNETRGSQKKHKNKMEIGGKKIGFTGNVRRMKG